MGSRQANACAHVTETSVDPFIPAAAHGFRTKDVLSVRRCIAVSPTRGDRVAGAYVVDAVGMSGQPHDSLSDHTPGAAPTDADLEAAGRLRADGDEVRARLISMTRDLEDLFAASADSNADDEHDPEGQTIAYERSQLSALIQVAQDHLGGIQAATARLQQGTYGICEVCHQPIPAARLEARPTARTCVRHTAPNRG